jgi:hypothetical protein
MSKTREQQTVHLPTRARELRSQADDVLARAEAKAAEIRAQARAEAQELIRNAEFLERMASGGDATTLQTNLQRETTVAMTDDHKASLSAARADDALSVAVREAGFPSMRAFAASPKVAVSPTLLAQAHKGVKTKGRLVFKPIKQSVCLRVQFALGEIEAGRRAGQWRFPATEKNWPMMVKGK